MKKLQQTIDQLSADELVSWIQQVWESSPTYSETPSWHKQMEIINRTFWYSQLRYLQLTGRYHKVHRILGRKC